MTCSGTRQRESRLFKIWARKGEREKNVSMLNKNEKTRENEDLTARKANYGRCKQKGFVCR